MRQSKAYDTQKLSPENQFFLFMIRLRRATDEQELVSFKMFQALILLLIVGDVLQSFTNNC
jgi:hypothetical protein